MPLNRKGLFIFLAITIIIAQYFFRQIVIDDWFIFKRYGDDYNYLQIVRNWDSARFKISGIVSQNEKNLYSYFFKILPKNTILYSGLIGACFFYSVVQFYNKLLTLSRSKKFAFIATLYFLVLPLKYLWLFSYYKDGWMLVSLLLIVSSDKRISRAFYGLILFFLRPIFAIIYLVMSLKLSYNKLILLFVSISPILAVLINEYSFFFASERLQIIESKLPIIFNNNVDYLVWILGIILLTFTLPIIKFPELGDIFSSISTSVNLNFLLSIPLVFHLIRNANFIYKNVYGKIFVTYTFTLIISFLFLTNRHIILVEPLKILFLASIYGRKKKYDGNSYKM